MTRRAGRRPAAAGRDGPDRPVAEDTCAALMRTLVGNSPSSDDIAVVVLRRQAAVPPAG